MTIAKRAAAAKFDAPAEKKPAKTKGPKAPAAQVVREKMPRMTD
ncbi:hypothetical protein [Sphingomicrobium arenosum]|nr:hypothetical protein [Sphingomicrobium arenosum]